MLYRLLVKILLLLAASVFAYSLWVVGMREEDNMKLLGGGFSVVLVLSVSFSLYYDYKR